MEVPSKLSLLDLSSQFPFLIDDEVKKEICFGETLVISCGHYDGNIGDETASEWSCRHDSIENEDVEKTKEDSTTFVFKDNIEEKPDVEIVEEEQNDFQFYFFPDCTKPLSPKDSKASLVIVDGLPKLNVVVTEKKAICTCTVDKKGECTCFLKLPCYCGAQTVEECLCDKLETVCTCHSEKPPMLECMCTGSQVCLCFPGGVRTTCTCDEVEKPCICHDKAGKFPSPICTCAYKPKFIKDLKPIGEEGEKAVEEEENKTEELSVIEPCTCQEVNVKPVCSCYKGNDCICKASSCICGEQSNCVCEQSEGHEKVGKSDDKKTPCSCTKSQDCTCGGDSIDCVCFQSQICTCGSPDNCKCFATCDCTEPCICDVLEQMDPPLECSCFEKAKKDDIGPICTCKNKTEKPKKLKKVGAGKEGYRWCSDVDPRHTYFDYAYDRHDKISVQEKPIEKVNILGLYDEKTEEECPVHGVEAHVPPYEKKIRKASIDCCSSVGGISFSVETLGDNKEKFLVQVVSHSSKEGAKSSTKLVSILDCNLHTMEENRTEQITKHSLTKERRSYMAICDNGYYNKMTRICGDNTVIKRQHYSFEDAKDFLLEGANVVLLRYFGLRRYRGNVKTETVMMNGTICESIYVSNGVSQAIVNGKPLFVVKVERHIIEPSGFVHQTLTVITLRGYMVSHEWADNNYLFHINPLLEIIPEKDWIESHAPLRETWREDLQLLSDYLDFKTTRTSEGGRYVTESGDLSGTVRDYLQALLLLRPEDALNFTRQYFSACLSALDLPHNEYFNSPQKRVRYYLNQG